MKRYVCRVESKGAGYRIFETLDKTNKVVVFKEEDWFGNINLQKPLFYAKTFMEAHEKIP